MPSFVIKEQQLIVKPDQQTAKKTQFLCWPENTVLTEFCCNFNFSLFQTFLSSKIQYQTVNTYNWRHEKAVRSSHHSHLSIPLWQWHTCTKWVQLAELETLTKHLHRFPPERQKAGWNTALSHSHGKESYPTCFSDKILPIISVR